MTETIDEPVGLDEFFDAYITAALWSSTNYDGKPLNRHHDADDIAPETLARMRTDCAAFLRHKLGGRLISIAEGLAEKGHWALPGGARCSVVEYAGHDFWLSRNGHGCGYWDGDWPRGVGEGLDKLAREFGTFDLLLGEDCLIYGQ